jgi:hypothetical protein
VRRALLSILTLLLLAVGAGSAVPASAAGGVFDDVTRSTPFARDIEWLAREGITNAAADRFRPDGPVTRQAMAVFLYKFAHDGASAPGCTADAYRDVRRSSPYCGSIRWLARAGITSGTASGGFAPLEPVTRQSMAAFLYKLDHDGEAPEPCTVAPYADVPKRSPFCGSIDWLWTEGITTGSLGGRFAPRGSVTRGMMAAFLHRFHVARTTPLGVDVGWPQCDADLPTDQAFGIVGVNYKKPRFFNPCFTEQLAWAARSSGARSQPKVQLYVNTANPAKTSDVWPCAGVTTACARKYGVDRAREDLEVVVAAGLDPADHVWWLDVEDGNSWERTSSGRARNRAVLEGMVAALRTGGVKTVGLYSTREQWTGIVGSVPSGSNLRGLPTWLTGRTAIGIAPARRMCADAPLTPGGTVRMVQFVEGGFDRNYVCA